MFKNVFYFNLILVLNQEQVFAFHPVTENNYVLVGHVFQTIFARDWLSCIQACHDDSRCTSYNYKNSATTNGLCELNDCGLEDLCDKDKFLIYSSGFVFQQIRDGKKDELDRCRSKNKRTEMSAPIDDPQNVRELNKTSTSIFITWDAVHSNQRNGHVLNYKITYTKFAGQKQQKTKNVTAPIVSVNLTRLTKNSRYNIIVLAANVYGDGPSSKMVTLRTDQDKPTVPPANVTAVNKTSTSILVTWDEVPPGRRKGYILRYNVAFTTATKNDTTNEIVNASRRYLKIVNLDKNTNYTITVSASTVKGYGPASESLMVVTDQDIPSAPPQEVRVANKTTTSMWVTWYEVPANQQNGKISSYTVTYTLMTQNVTETEEVEAPRLYLNLTGLQTNTNYSITVMASTFQGHGPASQAIYVITYI